MMTRRGWGQRVREDSEKLWPPADGGRDDPEEPNCSRIQSVSAAAVAAINTLREPGGGPASFQPSRQIRPGEEGIPIYHLRSEERRVGKECRSWVWTCQRKTKCD